jgi:hypothetical protein
LKEYLDKICGCLENKLFLIKNLDIKRGDGGTVSTVVVDITLYGDRVSWNIKSHFR